MLRNSIRLFKDTRDDKRRKGSIRRKRICCASTVLNESQLDDEVLVDVHDDVVFALFYYF